MKSLSNILDHIKLNLQYLSLICRDFSLNKKINSAIISKERILRNSISKNMAEQNKKQTVYISGPMSGEKDFNKEAFEKAENYWKSLGYNVVNPHNLIGYVNSKHPFAQYKHYMGYELHILSTVDCVAVLDDWTGSIGAKLEVQTALIYKLPIYEANTGKELCIDAEIHFKFIDKPAKMM